MQRITLKVTKRLNREQKKKITEGFRNTLLKITGPQEKTTVIIDEAGEEGLATKKGFFPHNDESFLKKMCYFYARD